MHKLIVTLANNVTGQPTFHATRAAFDDRIEVRSVGALARDKEPL